MNSMTGTPIVAIPRADHVLFVNRQNYKAVTLPLEAADQLRTIIQQEPPHPPHWLREALGAIGEGPILAENWPGAFILRQPPELGFERVAWEITERCNFRCIHCYLDEKTRPGLPFDERLNILDKIERAGCLWLQMTGGEVLADPLFGQTYRAAWNRGFLPSVSTNGQLIHRWLDLFSDTPPLRLTVSLYGASDASYEAMTGTKGAFQDVMNGLEAAHAGGINVRVSIIVTRVNAHEVADMEGMMRDRGFEHHTYWKLSPTLQGSKSPLNLEADIRRHSTFFQEVRGCTGGKSALHVYASGRASPCRLLPYIAVDLLTEEISTLPRLAPHPGTRLTKPECATCPSSTQCTTCAPVYALHKKAGKTHGKVCRW